MQLVHQRVPTAEQFSLSMERPERPSIVTLFSQLGLPAGPEPSSMQELQGYAVVVVGMLAAAGLSLVVQDTRPRDEEGGLMAH